MSDGKYTKEELLEIIERCCNDAAHIAVALFTQHIKDWIRGWIRTFAMQLLEWSWKPAVLGLLILIGWLVYKFKDAL